MERDAHLQNLFYLSSRVPSKGALPPGSLHRAPIEREMLHIQSPSSGQYFTLNKLQLYACMEISVLA
jgi:hypothetical protein